MAHVGERAQAGPLLALESGHPVWAHESRWGVGAVRLQPLWSPGPPRPAPLGRRLCKFPQGSPFLSSPHQQPLLHAS